MKIPLKIKIFSWYTRREVILIKDNLVKRNWNGSKKYAFCLHDETINHLFFDCKVARSIQSTIQVASNLYPPRSVANIFGNWLHGIDNKFRTIIRVGAIAIIWSLWLCRNDRVFNDKNVSFLQVIYRCTSCSVLGPCSNAQSFETSLQRCLCNWRPRRGTFLPNMGGSVICGLDHLHRQLA